jgi:hypothetical protein
MRKQIDGSRPRCSRSLKARVSKIPRQHSDRPDPCALPGHRVVGSVADHNSMLGRDIAGAEKDNIDKSGIGFVVLHVVTARDRIDKIADIDQRPVVIELVGRTARG